MWQCRYLMIRLYSIACKLLKEFRLKSYKFLQQTKENCKRTNSLSLSASHSIMSLVNDECLSRNRRASSVKQKQKRQRRMTILVVVMTLSFYVTWTPYAVISFMAMLEVMPSQVANFLAIHFCKSGVIVNPVLYIWFNNSVSSLRS